MKGAFRFYKILVFQMFRAIYLGYFYVVVNLFIFPEVTIGWVFFLSFFFFSFTCLILLATCTCFLPQVFACV